MGGRGASLGQSLKGKKYGTEYRTVHKVKNIKFIKQNEETSIKTPMETMTKGRIYATINNDNEIKAITTYDSEGKRVKQIDLTGMPHKVDGKYQLPHTHLGYFHDEKGTYSLSKGDINLIDTVLKEWNNFNRKK